MTRKCRLGASVPCNHAAGVNEGHVLHQRRHTQQLDLQEHVMNDKAASRVGTPTLSPRTKTQEQPRQIGWKSEAPFSHFLTLVSEVQEVIGPGGSEMNGLGRNIGQPEGS